MSRSQGALPDFTIRELINAEMITGAEDKNPEPASLDLSLSDEGYRVEGTFLPHPNETVREALESFQHSLHSFDTPLECGVTYVFRLNERVSLPAGVYGYCNPKSSTGRNDVHARVLSDHVSRYDSLTPKGYSGELWLSVMCGSYPVYVRPGEELCQMRLFDADTRFSETRLEIAMRKSALLWNKEGERISYGDIQISDNDGSLILSLDLSLDQVGWKAHGSGRPLDMTERRHYRPEDFFRPVHADNGRVFLEKGGFYILQTFEYVRVPPHLACEMVPMDMRSGEFRSHEAGYIDPGWGWGEDGEASGRPLTLEVVPFENLLIRHGQPIAKIRFEEMADVPTACYDQQETSNYREQEVPLLSKHFKIE